MRREIWLGMLLVLLTVAVYWPARKHQFTNFDDNVYVTENAHVRAGLTRAGVEWAFTSFSNSNWHPITWLSHMLDCQIFGGDPAGPHLMNVGWHAANSILLFALLINLTGAVWRSALVASLFAWHPMHVESVAWVAERKDLLSTFFGFLTLLAYVKYVKKSICLRQGLGGQEVRSPRFKVYYVLALVCFALGLMAKPMLVTLPLVMLLLDFWPLQRIGNPGRTASEEQPASVWLQMLRLLVEKTPFFALSAASCVITFIAQQRGGSIDNLGVLSVERRLENVPVAYLRYVENFFWPADLSVLYPFPDAWPLGTVITAVVVLLTVSVIVCVLARTSPHLAVGWFWFLITLVPVIGVVQVGRQSMADRYSYLPYVGLSLAVVWGVAQLVDTRRSWSQLAGAGGAAMLGACVWLTHLQLRYWQDSITLFQHAVAVTGRNAIADTNLGSALIASGKVEEGMARLREAIAILPDSAEARAGLASALAAEGRTREAIDGYRELLRRTPDMDGALNNLALILATDSEEANRNGAEAVSFAERACKLTQYQNPLYLGTLAAAYAEAGRFDQAVEMGNRSAVRFDQVGNPQLAAFTRELVKVYRSGRAYHAGM